MKLFPVDLVGTNFDPKESRNIKKSEKLYNGTTSMAKVKSVDFYPFAKLGKLGKPSNGDLVGTYPTKEAKQKNGLHTGRGNLE